MTDNYFSTRKTVRKFSDRPVDMALVRNMLEKASHAPTTGNMQLYSVVITQDSENIQQLAKSHFSQPASTGAKMLVTFCADFNRFEKWCKHSNAVPGYENFQSFVAAMLDAIILCQQFNTIAEMNGLGCCYLGTTTYNADSIASTLKLPNRVVPVATLAIGWPDGEANVTDRILPEGFIHEETYKDYSDNDIENVFGYKDLLAENKSFIEQNGKETLAQVFTDVRYPRGNNELFSDKFVEYLKANKFL